MSERNTASKGNSIVHILDLTSFTPTVRLIIIHSKPQYFNLSLYQLQNDLLKSIISYMYYVFNNCLHAK